MPYLVIAAGLALILLAYAANFKITEFGSMDETSPDHQTGGRKRDLFVCGGGLWGDAEKYRIFHESPACVGLRGWKADL